MNTAITLTPAERKQMIAEARRDLVQKLYDELAEDIQTVSKARLAGLMDVDPKTLDSIGIPRLPLTDKKLIKYRLRTVIKFLDRIEEK